MRGDIAPKYLRVQGDRAVYLTSGLYPWDTVGVLIFSAVTRNTACFPAFTYYAKTTVGRARITPHSRIAW